MDRDLDPEEDFTYYGSSSGGPFFFSAVAFYGIRLFQGIRVKFGFSLAQNGTFLPFPRGCRYHLIFVNSAYKPIAFVIQTVYDADT